MNLENLVDIFLSKSLKLLIFTHKENYISMLIEIDDSYVYGEKYYENGYLSSALSIKIFKKQKFKSLNFNQIRMLVTNQFYDDTFDELNLTKFLKKNRIYYHRWLEKDGIINTSTQRKINYFE